MSEEGLDIELLKARGLTCGKLRGLENKEMRAKNASYREASDYRKFGFDNSAKLKETIGNNQEQLAKKLAELRKKVCGLSQK
jgi:hypothetical protein